MDKEIASTSHYQESFYIGVTQRGCELLCRAGYEYTVKRINKDGSKLWRCARKNCNATIKTIDDMMTILTKQLIVMSPLMSRKVQ